MITAGSPTVSIVTVVYNQADKLEKTILSVLNQEYENIEYIIIDGGSTDGTIEVIKKYDDKISYWISERDKGIYDAMNKGIEAAKGEWINFMNCGDLFIANVISRVFSESHEGTDIIFGDAIIQYPTFEMYYKKIPLRKMWKAMPFCHQSTFVKTSLMREYKFDLTYKISADFDFVLKAYQRQKRFKFINHVICFFDFKEGTSKNHVIQSVDERRRSVLRNCGSFRKAAYYFLFLLYIRAGAQVKKFLGEKSTAWITRLLRT